MDDGLLIFRGLDYKVSDHIIIHQPTLDEICNYGEQKYFQLIYSLTSVGADLKWQLDDMGIDYTEVSDFELFYSLLIKGYTKEQTSILFGDLDFNKFQLCRNIDNDEIAMVQIITNEKGSEDEVIIDGYTYEVIVGYLRKIHGLKRNSQVPANKHTKAILIEDARDEYLKNKNKEYKSMLLNLISTMVNSTGFKYNHDTVWNMKINAFLDSVKRISKISNANILLQSGYSGYGINFKDIDKKQLDWLGELE